MSLDCCLHALGVHAPDKILTNADLEKLVDTSDEWIVERTGIHQRRQLADSENTSDLALAAAQAALAEAGVSPSALTHIVAATCTPDCLAPSVACILAGALDAGPVMAFDLSAACAGFIYGLGVCRALLALDPSSRILFVCAEALTRRLNWRDRGTCVLFGDGASAAVIDSEAADSLCKVQDVVCESDGKQKDLIIVGGGTACQYELGEPVDENFFLSMQGRDTYRHAVRQMVQVCEEILQRNNLSIDDIDLFIPHQANMRIIEAVGSRLKISPQRVFTNVGSYGNTSAASIPLAIAEARASRRIPPGARVLVTAFGAGLTWGAALLIFSLA